MPEALGALSLRDGELRMARGRQGDEAFNERRLSDASLATDEDDAPLAADSGRQMALELSELRFSPDEP